MATRLRLPRSSPWSRFALISCIICGLGVGWPDVGSTANGGALGRAFDALPKGPPYDDADFRQYAVFWSLIDEEVVRGLNVGRSVSHVQEMLQSFPGYEGPKKATGVRIGSAFFYSEPGSDTPTYRISQPHRDDDGLLIGVYNYERYSPGRLSVYARERGVWASAVALDAAAPLTVYVLTRSGRDLALATMDTFAYADRREGVLGLWRGRAGKLVPYEGHLYEGPVLDRLIDPDVAFRHGILRITYTAFLEHMCESVMGTRLGYELRVRARPGGIDVVNSAVTPWLETLGELYSRISAGEPTTARDLFDNPLDLTVLQPACGSISEHGGDLKRGRAWARIHDRSGDFHVEFVRRAPGFWKIARVVAIK